MLYHVHHIIDGIDTVRESFVQFDTAKRLALDLIATYGGDAYVTRASVMQWDSRGIPERQCTCSPDLPTQCCARYCAGECSPSDD